MNDEENAQRRAVSGSHCHPRGPELTEETATAIRSASASGLTSGGGARHFQYRREPYGRARIPTELGEIIIDGKVRAVDGDGPLLNLWRLYPPGRVLDVFIPRAWVKPIDRDDSAWIDVYDILGD